ncbi:MAG: type II and III secretion system protein family protein [Pseudomonadota bacterium]
MRLTQQMFRSSAIALALCTAPLAVSAQTQDANPMGVSTLEPGDTAVTRELKLGVDKSIIVDLDRPASDLIITNPEIADATVQTANRIIFRGIQAGRTNAFIFDVQGRPLLNLEIDVDLDTNAINELVARYVSGARVSVASANSNLVVSGTVANLSESDQVMRLVTAYLPPRGPNGEEVNVINMMTVRAKDQVMLEVRIVEMQRTVIKQLGINLSGETAFGDLAAIGDVAVLADVADDGIDAIIDTGETTLGPVGPFDNTFGFESSNSFGIQGQALGGLSTDFGYTNFNGGLDQSSVGSTIDALERIGVVKTLAEPNIMATSGESANFLAGGEFPVPVAQDEDGITVEFKPYGVGLAFTPVVLSEGRISLKISTEISELSNLGAFQGTSSVFRNADGTITTVPGLTIPALVVRRAESVVELPSGGSTMLAGLIQTRTRQMLDQLPGIKKLPILGALFQSRDFENQESELVVIVTPYLVDPTKKDELATPADGYVNASDPQSIFFGKLNAQYAEPGKGLSKENYTAPVGFIEE